MSFWKNKTNRIVVFLVCLFLFTVYCLIEKNDEQDTRLKKPEPVSFSTEEDLKQQSVLNSKTELQVEIPTHQTDNNQSTDVKPAKPQY